MAVTTFAAIDIGSYEISMKIFEFSKKIGFRELNDVRYRLEIGKGAYSRGRMEPEMVDDICVILKDFSNMMQQSRSRFRLPLVPEFLLYDSQETSHCC